MAAPSLCVASFQRERAQAGGAEGSGTGRSRLPAEQRARRGAPSQDPGIMT